MGIAIVIALIVISIFVWLASRSLSTNLAFTVRLGVIGLLLVIGGTVLRDDPEGLIQAAAALLTAIGVIFFIFGIVAFIRAILLGEFGSKE